MTVAVLAPADDALDAILGPMTSVASLAGIEPPAMEWLVQDTIPVGAVTLLFGDGGVGKTTTAMQIGAAVAVGRPVFGFATSKAKVHGYLCEDPPEELHRRFRACCTVGQIAQAAVTDFQYQSRFGLESLLGSFAQDGNFVPSSIFMAMRERAMTEGARLLILDNILHLYAGDVNSPGTVTRFLAALNRLALDIGGAVLLIGHIAKAEGSTFMGTAAWSNACRSRLFFGRPGDLQERRDLPGGFDPDARIFARLKANYAPISMPLPMRWHRGAFIREDDLPAKDVAEMRATVDAAVAVDRFLICLRERTRQRRAVSEKPCKTYAPKVFATMPEAKGLSERALETAMDELFRTGRIERAALWKGDDRKAVFGLRETLSEVREMPAGNAAELSAGDSGECAGNSAGNSGSHSPLDTTYLSGAALGPAAPVSEEGSTDVTAAPAATAFAGKVISLNRAELDHLSITYHAIADITAELTSIDSWLAGRPARNSSWRESLPGMLNRKHQDILKVAREAKAQRDDFEMPIA